MRRFCFLISVLIVVAALTATVYVLVQPRGRVGPPVRALWVTRFDYAVPGDVEAIIRNTAAAGFTDVFFQIRGNGTAYYRSGLEPWAWELSGGSVEMLGTDPGWDPLALALEQAAGTGLRVHAYLNVLPGWKGLDDPPVSADQLWTAHPDWFMVDSLGGRMKPTSGWYAFVNPVVPEVRAHLRGIARELCSYPVAGIHLDYIRYPYDYYLVADQHYPEADEATLRRHADFSYDPVSQAALFERFGWDVTREEIQDFRCESVTRVVRDISYVMSSDRPDGCVLSASVLGNPVDGHRHAYQDSGGWVRAGLIDWAVQMNYGTRSFEPQLEAMKKAAGRRGFASSVVVGLNCKNELPALLEQMDQVKASGSRGLALFSYALLTDEAHRFTEKGRALIEHMNR